MCQWTYRACFIIDAETLLQELEKNGGRRKRVLFQECRENPSSYQLMVAKPPLTSPSLLDRVQSVSYLGDGVRLLRKRQLRERDNAAYMPLQAKASLTASDDTRFPLMTRVKEFLSSDQKVFLLLGDSGAGKTSFSQVLELDLWQAYKKKTSPIPLYINLPTIEKPEHDMVAKHLLQMGLTVTQISELRFYRNFILICDGYDESQQVQNLYTSNRLNRLGGWSAKMVINCRSKYLGVNYQDHFQPEDHNRRPVPAQFQEAVITPFSKDQIKGYIKQYVSAHTARPSLWRAEEYLQALKVNPSFKELSKNPFMLTLSLKALPRMVNSGQELSTVRVTSVELYDRFVEYWLDRSKEQLGKKDLSSPERAAFGNLSEEFTQNGIDFIKKLSVAIYREQNGHPVVEYSHPNDEMSWKAAFVNPDDEKQKILREVCPLTQNGDQYRFIHHSLQEYGLALAIFDPRESATTEGKLDRNSPLVWRNIVNEPSILQFLVDRVQQKPELKQQLHSFIEGSKTDKTWGTAAANAITILVRAGVPFNGADLRGIRIPEAESRNNFLE